MEINVTVNVYVHPAKEVTDWMDETTRKLDLLIKTEQRTETEMSLDFTKMQAAATKQVGVTNSVLQVLSDLQAHVTDLAKQLADANAANDPVAQAAVQAQLDALATGIDSNDDKLAAAVAAPGTPGTPPPV